MRHIAWLAPLVLFVGCAPDRPADGTGDAKDQPPQVAVVKPLDATEEAKLREVLSTRLKGVKIDAIRTTPMAGVYEIQAGMLFGYTSPDGRYLIEGDMNDLEAGVQLTEASRKSARKEMLAKVSDAESIQFLPKEGPAKYHVTVFTDIDCGYCRMLHQHMAEYNAQGIAIRYLFFPRSGPDTASFFKAEEVWCAADRQLALTDAKAGKPLKDAKKDCQNPIAQHLALAGQLGLRGTPALILDDGEVIPGYQAPDALLNILAQHEAKASGAAPAAAAPAPAPAPAKG